MDAPQKTVAITLNNDDKTTPFLAQSWVTDADGVRTDALMALPHGCAAENGGHHAE
ncbi:hypothetical protein [Salmonella enterica]|uniref:hypothetical protein n=1 Tax=Salmonella enterica TaxID=28901 RepID=UPI0039B56D6F